MSTPQLPAIHEQARHLLLQAADQKVITHRDGPWPARCSSPDRARRQASPNSDWMDVCWHHQLTFSPLLDCAAAVSVCAQVEFDGRILHVSNSGKSGRVSLTIGNANIELPFHADAIVDASAGHHQVNQTVRFQVCASQGSFQASPLWRMGLAPEPQPIAPPGPAPQHSGRRNYKGRGGRFVKPRPSSPPPPRFFPSLAHSPATVEAVLTNKYQNKQHQVGTVMVRRGDCDSLVEYPLHCRDSGQVARLQLFDMLTVKLIQSHQHALFVQVGAPLPSEVVHVGAASFAFRGVLSEPESPCIELKLAAGGPSYLTSPVGEKIGNVLCAMINNRDDRTLPGEAHTDASMGSALRFAGTLLLGVNDDQVVVGQPLDRKQQDVMRLNLDYKFRAMQPAVSASLVRVRFVPVVAPQASHPLQRSVMERLLDGLYVAAVDVRSGWSVAATFLTPTGVPYRRGLAGNQQMGTREVERRILDWMLEREQRNSVWRSPNRPAGTLVTLPDPSESRFAADATSSARPSHLIEEADDCDIASPLSDASASPGSGGTAVVPLGYVFPPAANGAPPLPPAVPATLTPRPPPKPKPLQASSPTGRRPGPGPSRRPVLHQPAVAVPVTVPTGAPVPASDTAVAPDAFLITSDIESEVDDHSEDYASAEFAQWE